MPKGHLITSLEFVLLNKLCEACDAPWIEFCTKGRAHHRHSLTQRPYLKKAHLDHKRFSWKLKLLLLTRLYTILSYFLVNSILLFFTFFFTSIQIDRGSIIPKGSGYVFLQKKLEISYLKEGPWRNREWPCIGMAQFWAASTWPGMVFRYWVQVWLLIKFSGSGTSITRSNPCMFF